MRILHLIYTTGIAGAEKHLLDLLPALKKHSINCELICVCPQTHSDILLEYCHEMNAKGIKTSLFTTSSKFSFLTVAKKISQYLVGQHIGIIHSHLFSADLIAILVKKIYFKKLVILSTKHGYEEAYLVQYGHGNKAIRKNLYYFITKAVIKTIDHNLAVSLAISKMYDTLKLVKEIPYVQHGINPKQQGETVLHLKGDPNIMMAGRLSEMKGHTILIDAMPEILNEFPHLQLHILGIGPLKEKLINQARKLNVIDNIDFVGFANPADYTPHCQLMILPSVFEPFGLVYIESFALKIPVVALNAEAANEIIEDGETGALVPVGDIKSLAQKIIYLLQSSKERERIAENAYQKFISYYNADRMAKETADWYNSVIKH